VKSADWVATSGSLFAQDGHYWTGVPDSCAPDRYSERCTNSNVFRMNTRKVFTGAVRVSLAIRQNREVLDPGCQGTGTCWHGVHVWLRYKSQYDLYYASVQRADGQIVIKRKVPCGDENLGTYVELSSFVPDAFGVGQWRHYSVTVADGEDDSVVLQIFDDDVDPKTPVVTGIDRGGTNPNWSESCRTPGGYPSAEYPPIRGAGSVGVRGDFADFSFGEMVVERGRPPSTNPTGPVG